MVGQQGEQAVGHADGKVEGSWSSFFTMPRAATASVVYWETNRDWAATATTVRGILQGRGEADG